MAEFKVSVIIPVYNAAQYVRNAVKSAISLAEVGEIILIEDSSPDNALEICKYLEKEYPKVKLVQHSDKGNHGAGASRNLGIINATCEFIAFLDADDYYLPNRFENDKIMFHRDQNIDGVYNALGIEYYTESGRKKFLDAGYKYQEFQTVSGVVPPDELFFVFFGQHSQVKGEIHLDTLTVKKTIFQKVGYFNIHLRLKQDTHLWRRMAAKCNLASGNITEAVAIRGVHDFNRMVNNEEHKKIDPLWWSDLGRWLKREKVKKKYIECFELSYLYFKINTKPKPRSIFEFLKYFLFHPSLVKFEYGSFDTYFFHLFGKGFVNLLFISCKNKIFKHRHEGKKV
jgi:glycosyltransferase involved in cell wall biosynthesis